MNTNNKQEKVRFDKEIGNYPIKVVALGGLDENGKNCYVIEVNNDAFVIECGIKYPNNRIPGVDLIIPDFTYLKEIQSRIRAIIITHAHDDQYGALPYLLNLVNAPVYASQTTITYIKNKLEDKSRKIKGANFIPVLPSSDVVISGHKFHLFETTHSVAESFGFALETPLGNIVYTSDYISDYSARKGYTFDLPRIARISEEFKTFLLRTESESADKPGNASPNHRITDKVKSVFEDATGKIFVSLYTQNFFNIQEIINLSRKYRKKICIANKSDISLFDDRAKQGMLRIPDSMRVTPDQIPFRQDSDVVVLVTGSGEELFNLSKDICYNGLENIRVNTKDSWINAAPSVPGTEVLATDASDTIFRTDCHVLALSRKELASRHAQQEDIKMRISLFRPHYYLPVKGEFRLLTANAQIALNRNVGLNNKNIFVFDNGMALAFDDRGRLIHKNILLKTGDVLVDGNSVGEVKEAAIEERQKMADGGIIILSLAISRKKHKIVSSPDVQRKGFLYRKEFNPLRNQISTLFTSQVQAWLSNTESKQSREDRNKKIAEKRTRFLRKETKKEPMVRCELINVDSLQAFDSR